ncbi:MAG: ORF6N domain-containing protein [Cyanobacteria bacterium REEB65]|nr:ORF6N domain-containing protein [Cyanobacteria bacterium REEB65]
MDALLPVEAIAARILELRGQRVMLDADLAALFGVETRALNQAIRRNLARFPEDFVFRLTEEEKHEVITKCDHLANLKFSPSLPYAFSEHGAVMASMVLKTPVADAASVAIVRAFVRMRRYLAEHEEIRRRLEALEGRMDVHDDDHRVLFEAINLLMEPPAETLTGHIGFRADGE